VVNISINLANALQRVSSSSPPIQLAGNGGSLSMELIGWQEKRVETRFEMWLTSQSTPPTRFSAFPVIACQFNWREMAGAYQWN
jgi:hypothetical protein